MTAKAPLGTLVVTDSAIWNAETEYALAVAAAEAAMGCDVTLAAPRESVALERAPGGIRVEELPGESLSRSPADLLAAGRWISGHLHETATAVVHSSRSTAHVVTALAKTPSAKLVHLRGGAAPPRPGAFNRLLYRRRTDAVVASSGRIEMWLRGRLGLPPDRVFRIYLPVDVERFAAGSDPSGVRSEFGITGEAPLVVNVARLAPVKGHGVLLEAWAQVARRQPSAVLLLVGEGWSGQPEALSSLARKLGIEARVRFAGRREDVPELLAAADVCVCSSIGSEENSRAVSEYMAAGRAVVATSVGVIPELVTEGETGLLVPPSDLNALAGALLELLDDSRRAGSMGDAGQKRARAICSRRAFAGRLVEVLAAVGVDADMLNSDAQLGRSL